MRLHVEAEVDHVAVLDHILLALAAEQALLLGGGHALPQAIMSSIGDDLGADEAPLEVGVDLAGGLGRLGALFDGPGAALVLAVGQEGDQAQQGVASTGSAGPGRTPRCPAPPGTSASPRAVQLGDVLLQLGADGQHLRALLRRPAPAPCW